MFFLLVLWSQSSDIIIYIYMYNIRSNKANIQNKNGYHTITKIPFEYVWSEEWRWIISSFSDLHFTQMALFWLSGHQPCAYHWPGPPLTLLQVSLFSPSHIYMHRGVRIQTHTHQHACRSPIRQCLAHSAFLLPTDWRTEVAREGWGRGELRGKTAGHMSRDLFTNPRQSRARGGRERQIAGSLWAPLWIERGRREACHDKASWRCKRLNATHADTLLRTHRLCLRFFSSQLKQQMVRGRVGSPPTRTHIHWLKHKHTLASKTPNPARGLLLTAWSCPHFVWALKEAYLCLLCWGEISTARSEDWRRRQQRRQEGDETCENPLLKKAAFQGRQSTD